MPREEPQRWEAEEQLSGQQDWGPFCSLPGRAETGEGRDAGRAHQCYRMLLQGVAPVCRSPLLSASGGSAVAAALEAPQGSEQCSAVS